MSRNLERRQLLRSLHDRNNQEKGRVINDAINLSNDGTIVNKDAQIKEKVENETVQEQYDEYIETLKELDLPKSKVTSPKRLVQEVRNFSR